MTNRHSFSIIEIVWPFIDYNNFLNLQNYAYTEMNFFSKLTNFIFSKKFLINFGGLVMVYFIVMIATIYYLNVRTHHGQKIEVKDYIGQNINEVKAKLSSAKISYEIVDSVYEASKPEGTILYQRPLPSAVSGVFIKEERKIYFRVSKRSKLVEIPSMVDRSERYAVSVLQNMGFKTTVSYTPSSEAAGAVLEQLFRGKPMRSTQKIPIGSTITLIVGEAVNTADVNIPDLSCLTISEANARLQDVGLVQSNKYVNCRTFEDSARATVTSQNPAFEQGMTVPYGSTISITLDGKGCN